MSNGGYGYIRIGGIILEKDIANLCLQISGAGAHLWFDGVDGAGWQHRSGHFAPNDYADLSEALDGDGLITLSDWEATDGRFEELESFCDSHSIEYDRHSDQLDFCAAHNQYYRKGHGTIEFTATNDGTNLIPVEVLSTTLAFLEAGKKQDAIAFLRSNIYNICKLAPVTFETTDGRLVRLGGPADQRGVVAK